MVEKLNEKVNEVIAEILTLKGIAAFMVENRSHGDCRLLIANAERSIVDSVILLMEAARVINATKSKAEEVCPDDLSIR